MTHDRTNESNGHAGRDAELNALLKQLRIEQAPERLTRRLYRIPQEESRKARRAAWRRKDHAELGSADDGHDTRR